MEPLIADEFLHRLQVLHRGTAGYQLVQDGVQLRFGKSAAFQQDFTDCQHLAFGQPCFGGLFQLILVRFPVILQIVTLPGIVGPQDFQVPLKAFFAHFKPVRHGFFVNSVAAQQLLLQGKQAIDFILGHDPAPYHHRARTDESTSTGWAYLGMGFS